MPFALDVLNNASAPEDLLIEVAGGGRATISQDAVPDERVFDVFPNANVTMFPRAPASTWSSCR